MTRVRIKVSFSMCGMTLNLGSKAAIQQRQLGAHIVTKTENKTVSITTVLIKYRNAPSRHLVPQYAIPSQITIRCSLVEVRTHCAGQFKGRRIKEYKPKNLKDRILILILKATRSGIVYRRQRRRRSTMMGRPVIGRLPYMGMNIS